MRPIHRHPAAAVTAAVLAATGLVLIVAGLVARRERVEINTPRFGVVRRKFRLRRGVHHPLVREG